MKSKWIYIAIETDVRELDSKLLLSLELVSKNFNVLLGSSKNIIRMSRYFPKGAFFLKDSASFNYSKYKYLRLLGHKIIVHDEEGFVTNGDESYIEKRLNNDTLREIDLFLCWGKHQENLVKQVASKINNFLEVITVGHPRIDILRREFISKPKKYNRILINTKTAAYNYIGGSDKFIEDFTRLEYIKSKAELKFFQERIKYDEKLFNSYHDLIQELSLNFRNIEIVIRPHPSEDENTWRKLFKNKSNVIISKKDSVNKWIEKSDLVIHTGCTTGIEASLMNSIVINYQPFTDNNNDTPLPNLVSLEALGIENVIKLVSEILNTPLIERGKFLVKDRKEILSKYVSNIDGMLSCEKIQSEISKLDLDTSEIGFINNCKLFIRNLFNKIKKEKNDRKFSNINSNLLIEKSRKYSHRYDMENITISEVYNNVFLIKKSS